VYENTSDVVRASIYFAKEILDAVTNDVHVDNKFLTRSVSYRQNKIVDIGPLRTNLRLVAIDDGGLVGEWKYNAVYGIAYLEAKGPPLAGEDVDEMSDQDFGQTLAHALGARLKRKWEYYPLKK
jgi:hypothetical protein